MTSRVQPVWLGRPSSPESSYSQPMSDAADERAIRGLIAETYAAMSSGEPGTARFFAHPDIGIAGSGQGELVSGPEMAARMAEAVTRLGYRWSPEDGHRLGARRLRLGPDRGNRHGRP